MTPVYPAGTSSAVTMIGTLAPGGSYAGAETLIPAWADGVATRRDPMTNAVRSFMRPAYGAVRSGGELQLGAGASSAGSAS